MPEYSVAIWQNAGLEVAERILGLGDRKTNSAVSGCYDRMYWKYRLIDYPSGWFQSAAEYLALLYSTPGSAFSGQAQLRQWAIQAYDFTLSIQNRDGSIAEVYPYERSFCATAFVAVHLFSLCRLIGHRPDAGLKKMAQFLQGHRGERLGNQLAAAALAELYAYEAFKEKEFLEDARKKLQILYDSQSQEGYFYEYGGLDIGYLSITLSLLARLDEQFKGELDLQRIKKALFALQGRVREDGTYEYRTMSRRTQFLYPLVWPTLKARC